MTTGQRIAKGRKSKGMTQEQLAEQLGVTRQSVSRWESDAVYPETEKLIRLADLLGLTCDQLLRGVEPERPASSEDTFRWKYEYKSRRTLWGLPLLHISVGFGPHCRAKGIVALGNVAMGLVAVGGASLGVLAVGGAAAGGLALGGLALAVLAIGGGAVGVIAVGGLALGYVAIGGLALGIYALGGWAMARDLAGGGYASGKIAIGDAVNGTCFETSPRAVREDSRALLQAMEQYLPNVQGWIKRLLQALLNCK